MNGSIFINGIVKMVKPFLLNFADKKVSEYGTLLNFDFDYEKKQIQVALKLKGESDILYVTMNGIYIKQDEGKAYIKVTEVITSREWMTILAKKWSDDKFGDSGIEIPLDKAKLLKKIL